MSPDAESAGAARPSSNGPAVGRAHRCHAGPRRLTEGGPDITLETRYGVQPARSRRGGTTPVRRDEGRRRGEARSPERRGAARRQAARRPGEGSPRMGSGATYAHQHVTFEETDQQDADLRVPLRSMWGGVRNTGSGKDGAQLSILRRHGSRAAVLPPDGPVVIDPRTEHEGGEEAREGPGDGADDRPARIRAGPRRLAFVSRRRAVHAGDRRRDAIRREPEPWPVMPPGIRAAHALGVGPVHRRAKCRPTRAGSQPARSTGHRPGGRPARP